MKATLGDEGECRPRIGERRGIGTAQERGKVNAVLWASSVVTSKHLQSNEVAEACDCYGEAWHGVDHVRVRHDLGFDAGRGEEEVDDRSPDILTIDGEPGRRQGSRRILLERSDNAPTAGLETAYKSLGIRIPGDRDGKIGVARESRLGSG